jgi:peptide/nickel transport system ATP-binding protein
MSSAIGGGTLKAEGDDVPSAAGAPLLELRGIRVAFADRRERRVVVRGVDLQVRERETLGLVGESGSGKTTTLRSVIRLLPPAAMIEQGEIIFEGRSVLDLSREGLRKLRANAIGTVFQDPYSTLNPVARVGHQLAETMQLNLGLTRREAWVRAIEALDHVGIPAPDKHARSYPHELSGGMRQRVMFAMAIAARPRLLLADEPTTALDVTTQAQILALLVRLRGESNMATVLVSHDLGVIAQTCDTVAVMYAGNNVERGPAREVYRRPHHPYTQGLLKSIPSIVPPGPGEQAHLSTIPGQPPSLQDLPEGCPFAPRCPYVQAACRVVSMALESVGDGHLTACPFVRSPDVD